MRFDRKTFFEGFRDRLDATIEQEQVDGLEFLLSGFESDDRWLDIRHVAYALATIFHETASSFQPVEEGYYLGAKARVERFQRTLRYFPFFGRGYVQLTWEENYEKAGDVLGLDLVRHPELALDPTHAFRILTEGLFRGWFGSKLTTHINDKKTDYINARRCVNVLDKAGLIAGYAKSFEKILRQAKLEFDKRVFSDDEVDLLADSIDSTAGDPAGSIGKPSSEPQNESPSTVDKPVPDEAVERGNVDAASSAPVTETKIVDAPPAEGSTATATKVTVAGFVVPTFLVSAVTAIKSAFTEGFVSPAQVGEVAINFISANTKYVFAGAGLIIAGMMLKKLYRQITLWLQMYFAARSDMNDVQVKPQ